MALGSGNAYLNCALTTDNSGKWKIDTGNTGNDYASLNTVYYDWWYPYHYRTHEVKDDMKKAFNIAKNLMDKKLIKCNTVKQFIDLVDIIVKEL